MGFGCSVNYGCVSGCKGIGCKLLLVIVREEIKQRKVDSVSHSEKIKGGYRNDRLLNLLLN